MPKLITMYTLTYTHSGSFTLLIVLLITVGLYKLSSIIISKFLWNKFSITKDIHILSKSRPSNTKLLGTAIVCGGSIAGLLAARVCANHFEKIIIIEAEEWIAVGDKAHSSDTENQQKRARVAQYSAYHHLQLLITSTMNAMFPGFEQAVQSVGGRLTLKSNIFWMSGRPMLIPSGFPYHNGELYPSVINLTRPVFEPLLRRLVLKNCKEVQYLHGTVSGLLYDETANRLTGVTINLPNGGSSELRGSIVVDATGSFMGGFRWLKALPKFSNSGLDDLKISFDPKVSYTGCNFILPPKVEEEFRRYGMPVDGDTHSKLHASIPMNGENDKFFAFEKRHGNFLQMGCGGYDWKGKIRSLGDIEDYVRKLNVKQPLPEWIYDVLHTLQSEGIPGEFAEFKYPLSVYIKYHEAKNLPSNLVVVGDAQAQTNPLLGQGICKAAANAIILNYHLHQVASNLAALPQSFSQQYFLDVKTRTGHTWESLKCIDYNFPTTTPISGENVQTTAWFARTYSNIFLALAAKDADVSGAFYRQVSWIDPATSTFAPWLARRIFWAWVKQSFGYEIL